jgi:hypothetical protein
MPAPLLSFTGFAIAAILLAYRARARFNLVHRTVRLASQLLPLIVDHTMPFSWSFEIILVDLHDQSSINQFLSSYCMDIDYAQEFDSSI